MLMELEISRRTSGSTQISNFIKIRPVGAELFHGAGRTDGQTVMTKLIVAFRNFANAQKSEYIIDSHL
jgi:hypothetical protein